MRYPRCIRALALIVLIALLAGPVVPARATRPTVAVAGLNARWRVQLIAVHSTYRIPRTSWKGYRSNLFRFVVVTLRMANVGVRAADPYDDLALVLKVLPSYPTKYPLGWAPLARPGFTSLIAGAARAYGGTVPWQPTRPGRRTTYTIIFGMWRGESHYGLYGSAPNRPSILLLRTGL